MNPYTDKQKAYLIDLLNKDREIHRILIADLKNVKESHIEQGLYELIPTIDMVIQTKEECLRTNAQILETIRS